ncbi:hypothetical protein M951_chr1149 (nucleomorph) [Lotharella oceanica]|uniref:Uncharacterized protein n=1 Tax=Lotharella oceanica TaxID=641309 RepID=A0A060DFL8_9EUKA|nr:hypothetical protein M951_chr1149 [Lotharella oceanica]
MIYRILLLYKYAKNLIIISSVNKYHEKNKINYYQRKKIKNYKYRDFMKNSFIDSLYIDISKFKMLGILKKNKLLIILRDYTNI